MTEDTETTNPAAPVGASVADIRRANDAIVRPEPEPRFVRVGSARSTSGLGRAVLVDMGSGCQYVVRTLYQDALDVSPLVEAAPGTESGVRQRCGRPRPGSDEIVVLVGGDISNIHVWIERDRETGCEDLVTTIYQDDIAVVPRIAADGDARRQICRKGA